MAVWYNPAFVMLRGSYPVREASLRSWYCRVFLWMNSLSAVLFSEPSQA